MALLASQLHWVTGFNVAVAVAKAQWCYRSTISEANALINTGSAMPIATIGMRLVACLAGRAAVVLSVTMTSTLCFTNSAAASRSRSAFASERFLKGLAETGYIDDRNVAIQYRWAEGQNDRLPEMAADLVRRKV